MNPWITFAAGFGAAIVAILALVLVLYRLSRVTPLRIGSSLELQRVLRDFLDHGAKDDSLFVRDAESRLLVRVTKFVRRTTDDTLGLELRRSESGLDVYQKAREALRHHGIEFTENYTPKQRLPRRLLLRFPSGGPLAITFVEGTISVICEALHPGRPLDLLLSGKEPYRWIQKRRRPPS